jgi:cytochrome c2
MRSADIAWDDAALDKFLTSPGGLVHGTKNYAPLNLTASNEWRRTMTIANHAI